jgi:hypothetical protein
MKERHERVVLLYNEFKGDRHARNMVKCQNTLCDLIVVCVCVCVGGGGGGVAVWDAVQNKRGVELG